MIVEKHGVQLKRVREEDIELIRVQRNSSFISSRMIYQKEITPEQQLEWFNSVNNFSNFYYLIIFENRAIGLINDKDVDWNNRSSESGLFIWEQKYLKTIVPSLASMCLLEMGYEILGWNKTRIKVLKSNEEAVSFNKQVGFQVVKEQEGVLHMELTRDRYLEKARKYLLSMTKLSEDHVLQVDLDEQDIKSGLAEKIHVLATEFGVKVDKKESEYQIHYSYTIS